MTPREEIESLGWTVVLAEEANVRDLGDGLFQRVPGRYAAEKVCSVAGRNLQTHRREALSLESLLEQIQSFEATREALGKHGPEVEKQ
jgi:hypothetical protein